MNDYDLKFIEAVQFEPFQEEYIKKAETPKVDEESLKKIQNIIKHQSELSGTLFKKYILDQIYGITIDLTSQGIFVSCPLDMHKGPFFCFEDNYQYIFGEETDKKIHDNCNVELFKQIDETNISYGAMKYAEGNRWMNGMICYNKNSICIRNEDNNNGQPGFLSAVYYYDRLGIEIMKQYIVPELIRAVKEKRINTNNGWAITRTIISNTYDNVRTSKMAMLNGVNITYVNKSTLFEDAPREEKPITEIGSTDEIKSLMHVIDEKDRKIDALEKKVESLSARLNMVLSKITELEDIFLDVSIKMNTPDQAS